MARFVDRDGWLWPVDDKHCHAAVFNMSNLDLALGHVRNFGVCVQAGGNCGVWPRRLAEVFGTVYTFEPDAENFHCLVHNVPALNVVKLQAVLASSRGCIGLAPDGANNCGAYYVQGEGAYPSLMVDDLALSACDFICLDVEGKEPEALSGAWTTIMKHRPVVMVEEKGLSVRFGYTPSYVEEWLGRLSYRVAHRLPRDLIFVPT